MCSWSIHYTHDLYWRGAYLCTLILVQVLGIFYDFFYHFGELAASGRSKGPTSSSELHAWTNGQEHHHLAMVVVKTRPFLNKKQRASKVGQGRSSFLEGKDFFEKKIGTVGEESKKKKKKNGERKIFSKGDREVSSGKGAGCLCFKGALR